jgi:cation:H+ antiporter
MILTIVLLIVGLVLLVFGADWLVKGASRLAISFGISALVVGLTVVAYGTSAPEMSVSVMSSFNNQSAMALGNIVGSNIFNVLFILGIAALVTPLIVNKQLIRLDVPVMIAASVVLLLVCLDGVISRIDGILLFAGVVFYTWWLIRMSRRETRDSDEENTEPPGKLWQNLLWIIMGLGMLILGSRFLVNSAVEIAKALNISETIIGLTIIAAGTSLPEVATSVMASIRGQRDIAVGNVVGSNVFNILAVGGLSAVVAPAGIIVPDAILRFDMPFMLAVAIACFPIFFRGYVINRWNGAFFLSYYIAYTCYLVLGASNHDALPVFSKIMFEFVAPLTGVMLVALLVFEWRLHHKPKA